MTKAKQGRPGARGPPCRNRGCSFGSLDKFGAKGVGGIDADMRRVFERMQELQCGAAGSALRFETRDTGPVNPEVSGHPVLGPTDALTKRFDIE